MPPFFLLVRESAIIECRQMHASKEPRTNPGRTRRWARPLQRVARSRRAAKNGVRAQLPLIGLAVGAMLSLASSVVVYNAWRVALHAASYRPEVFVVSHVTYRRGRRSHTTGVGTVNGRPENIGFSGFELKVASQAQLDALYPAGARIEILYDPLAADVMTQGEYLRVLPRAFPLDSAFRSAIKTTLAWNGLTLIGLALTAVRRYVTIPPNTVDLA